MSGIERLSRIAAAPSRRILGLMSGTSLDGIDAALVRVAGSGPETHVELEGFRSYPFEPELRAELQRGLDGSVADVCQLDFAFGEALARASLRCLDELGVAPDTVDLIASHGQTLYHVDPSQPGTPSTLQVGSAAVLRQRTGCIVIHDFRSADVAVGGRGAPLVPYLDHCLFARPGEVSLLQNIGGIANVTVVTESIADVLAFDTGPGNVVIDAACRALLGDPAAFDQDGQHSREGAVDEALLERLLGHPYFALDPPKSTGREVFGAAFTTPLLRDYPVARRVDLLATLVHLVARSIADAYRRFVLPRWEVERVWVSGGGAHNLTLMSALREALPGLQIRSFDEANVGFSADAKEAVAFALLANETVQSRPSNVPAATGATRPVVLGSITV